MVAFGKENYLASFFHRKYIFPGNGVPGVFNVPLHIDLFPTKSRRKAKSGEQLSPMRTKEIKFA